MNRKLLGYWLTTGIFCAALGFGGVAHLLRADAMAQGIETLGYPPYLMTILGTAKVLGVLALLAPGRPLLQGGEDVGPRRFKVSDVLIPKRAFAYVVMR